jgi:hypothetical protein
VTPAQREFYEDYGRRKARQAPPLTPAQVEAIARLLATSAPDSSAPEREADCA